MQEFYNKHSKIIIFGTFALVAIIELLMGRNLWCPAGDISIWSIDINSIHNSQHLIDAYSLTHISHGIIFLILLSIIPYFKKSTFSTKLLIAVFIESFWEIIENSSIIINRFRESTISLGYLGDSIANSLSDIIFMMLGLWIASKMPTKYAFTLVIIFEIVCYLLIRDNLILEIIQIIHPLK
ncbi:MAG: DUF2585 family protein [Candidatus Paceibacterota bacterium]